MKPTYYVAVLLDASVFAKLKRLSITEFKFINNLPDKESVALFGINKPVGVPEVAFLRELSRIEGVLKIQPICK